MPCPRDPAISAAPHAAQVRLPSEVQVERFKPPGGVHQQMRVRRSRSLTRTRRVPRTRSTRARWKSSRGPVAAVARRASAASNAPAWRLAWAAASARSPRSSGSSVSATERCRNAAAAASPPRAWARLADRSSSAATRSLGPGVARARCQTRRSGSVSGSVASASARCTRWRISLRGRAIGGGSDERMRELDARPDLEQAGFHRGVDGCHLETKDLERRGARSDGVAERLGAAAAMTTVGCRPEGREGAGRSSVRSFRPPAGWRETRTLLRARRASRCAGARAAQAGCHGSR